jgi:hypothetical protein
VAAWLKKDVAHSTSPNEPTDITERNEYHMCSLQSRGSCYMNQLQSERDSDWDYLQRHIAPCCTPFHAPKLHYLIVLCRVRCTQSTHPLAP